MQTIRRGESAGGIVSKQRRYLQRYPSVDAVSPVKDGSKQIGRPREILECQLEEQPLSGLTLIKFLADRSIVRAAVFNRVVEDRRVRSEPGHRQLVDIAFQCAGVQQVACNIVEPQTLAQVVEQLGCFHLITS